MEKKFLSFCAAAALAVGFTACNSTGTTSDTKDTTAPTISAPASSDTTTAVTSTSSLGNYAAMADTVEKNSQQGYYLNSKTGKPYKSLKVDRTTGHITDEAGEPVWRYVDNRTWWVYGGDNWEHMGDAKMQDDKVMYKGDGDKWVDYDTRWKSSDDGMKQKMVTKDGDKIKIKTDEEGNTKIKVNDEKIKMDKDGKVKKD